MIDKCPEPRNLYINMTAQNDVQLRGKERFKAEGWRDVRVALSAKQLMRGLWWRCATTSAAAKRSSTRLQAVHVVWARPSEPARRSSLTTFDLTSRIHANYCNCRDSV